MKCQMSILQARGVDTPLAEQPVRTPAKMRYFLLRCSRLCAYLSSALNYSHEANLLTRFTPPQGVRIGLEQSPDPYISVPAVGARELALASGPACWAHRQCSPSLRPVPHARLHIPRRKSSPPPPTPNTYMPSSAVPPLPLVPARSPVVS